MGNCIYCGKPAGLLRSKHAECDAKEKARVAVVKVFKDKLRDSIVAAVLQPSEAGRIKELIDEAAQSGKLTQEDVREAIIAGWCSSVEKCLEDGVIDVEEERKLMAVKNGFKFTEEDLDKTGAHTRVVKAAVIRDVLAGAIPERFNLSEPLPINLQKGEKVVWAFGGCEYWEDKTKRTYQGGSRGASIKVMQGVYYRVGAFKGAPVYSTERVLVDKGAVYITDRHIYFAGPAKSLRVPYSKVVSFIPFDDGVGLVRDAQTAKPQIFKTGDGWFTYNLVTNLAQL
ncbi:MAG: hypothetical protein QY325_10795 [Flavobacteriales bacterium]|nr:MAG: hypothetical protein QY325_10795 [Flavobacteriales bacterium]